MISRLVPLFVSACGAVICLGLGACKNTSGGGEYAAAGDSNIVDYAGLPKDELPFDEKGNYREDWVSGTGSSSGRGANVSDSPYVQEDGPVKRTTTSTSQPASRPSSSVAKTSSTSKTKSKATSSPVAKTSSGSKTKTTSKSKSKATAKSKPKPKAKPVARTTLYTVAKGDTLSAISRKTGRSVSSIKGYNGMKTDFLRDGWVIKLPPKK